MKKWYAVIGDPIAQSMSPAMHDAWFKENGIDASYIPVRVKSEDLEKTVASLKQLGCSGWNVTVPHKTAIIPFLDEVDEAAKQMNAVNTVCVMEDGTLYGTNTDGRGFYRSLEEVYPGEVIDRSILMIGAGGAASGIAFALHEAGCRSLTFTNRTVEKAQQLQGKYPDATVLSIEEAEAMVNQYSLLVQTTSVGMNYAQSGMPLNPTGIHKDTIVADIIYNPLETEFLHQARISGGRTVNGIGMFVHQGALAFELWTSIYPDTTTMIQTISEKLGGN